MMTLRHDDMMERSPLPPQAGNTRFSYNDRGAHWESSGRRNEKMMIGGQQHEPATGRRQQKEGVSKLSYS